MCLCKENTDPLEQRLPPRASVGICPNAYFCHLFRVEGFLPPGVCGGVRSGFGDQSPAIPQPVSDLMGLYSDFARLPREEILKGRGWRPMLENLPGLLEHGDTMSWLFPHRARSFPGVLRASSL